MTKKTSNINIRVSDDLRDQVDYLKLCPGGITKFIEDALRLVKVDRDLLDAWRRNQRT